MDELNTQASAIVDAARDAMSPTEADRARVSRAVAVAVAGVAAGTASTAYAGGAARVAGWFGASTKWLAAIGVAVTIGTSAGYVATRPHAHPHRAAAVASASHVESEHAAPPVPARAHSVAPVAPVAPPVMAVAASATSKPRASVHKALSREAAAGQARPGVPLTAAEQSRSDREINLLERASAALRAGQGAEALSLLREHASSFPNGMLVPEREGLRVLALCASGDLAAAVSEGASFLARSPRSPLAARIRSGCRAEP